MKACNIAILGATGVVGRQMIQVLEEYKIPVKNLVLLASAKSQGQKLTFNGKEIEVQEAREDSFTGMDYVLGAVGNKQAEFFASYIVKSGAVFIDNSSAFRMKEDVPLVIPEINGDDAFRHNGIIANPNCSTIITMMAVAGIARLSPLKNMIACTYQAVSGAGIGGLQELENQNIAIVNGKKVESRVFPVQIAMNVIPCIGSYKDNGYTSEEMKMQNEGRKILHLPDFKCSCTCVRVPVLRSHSIAVTLRTERKITVAQAENAVRNFEGCALIEDLEGRNYPTPLDASDKDVVMVGRIRQDLTDDNGLSLWCCGDQVRKGAASNAVQILRLFISSSNEEL